MWQSLSSALSSDMNVQLTDNTVCSLSRDIHCHSHLTHYLSYGRVKSLFTLHWPNSYQLLVTVTWITDTTHCHVTMPPVAAAFLRTLQPIRRWRHMKCRCNRKISILYFSSPPFCVFEIYDVIHVVFYSFSLIIISAFGLPRASQK